MLSKFIVFLKGVAMGAANVIPGVSGGTIALITNIFEELIDSIKKFDKTALKMLLKKDFKNFFNHINYSFLTPIFLGIVFSIFSLAKLFEFLLEKHPQPTWAFFFGLVLASVYYVGIKVENWNLKAKLSLLLGFSFALGLSFIESSSVANTNYLYIFICGMIGICGMVLPGLSGSYILMLMGNYELLMVKSISSLFDFLNQCFVGNFNIILSDIEMQNNLIYFIIFLVGSIVGLLVFSNLISYIFKRYFNITISILTGFVLGSLSTIWPWKKEIFDNTIFDRDGQPVITGYERYIPETIGNGELLVIFSLIIGMLTIIAIEQLAKKMAR
ncbi:MAG: DUF368 domain-containing protein [Flavobacteriales bacterium]